MLFYSDLLVSKRSAGTGKRENGSKGGELLHEEPIIKPEVFSLGEDSWGGKRDMVRDLYIHEQQEEGFTACCLTRTLGLELKLSESGFRASAKICV